jgi:hypothetical protein
MPHPPNLDTRDSLCISPNVPVLDEPGISFGVGGPRKGKPVALRSVTALWERTTPFIATARWRP